MAPKYKWKFTVAGEMKVYCDVLVEAEDFETAVEQACAFDGIRTSFEPADSFTPKNPKVLSVLKLT